MASIQTHELLNILENLAPLGHSAEWDNTGLLLESHSKKEIQKILLTLDLTPAVAAEAILKKADWIISYHPPIFSGLKTLSREKPLTAALLDLLKAGISVYSPHTALDAVEGGVSDWLCEAFPVDEKVCFEGSGRKLSLKKSLTAKEVGEMIEFHIRAPYLRVSSPVKNRKIKTLALCPGAGATVLGELEVDAVFTGEMRHHDLLKWQSGGTYVFLSEHGHTERPYLKVFRKKLEPQLPQNVQVIISKRDREPLDLVMPDA